VWDRQQPYSPATPLTFAQINERKGSKQVRYQDNNYPDIVASIYAGKQDQGWLDVDAAPATAPNTGVFWCPELFVAGNGPSSATGSLWLSMEVSLIVEFRGTKI
jgi:hypothetical protein